MVRNVAVLYAMDKATDCGASEANIDSLLNEHQLLIGRVLEAINTHEELYGPIPRWMLDVLDAHGIRLRDAACNADEDFLRLEG